MNAYVPKDAIEAWIAITALPVALILGYFVTHIRWMILARCISWFLVFAGMGGMEWYTRSQPPGFRMLVIIGLLLSTMKIVVVSEARQSGKANLSFLQWIGFAGLWVGMRPALFTQVPREPRNQWKAFTFRGLKNIGFGLVLVLIARAFWITSQQWSHSWRLLVTTGLLLPGLSLMLHFGVFNLLTGFWRWQGAECESVFREPLKSKSLSEFWGKRWNLAFSEMTTLAVFRPIRVRFGQVPAMLTAFLFSGLLHELAISVPVRAGFGWPLLYFVMHGVGMLIENRWVSLARTIEARPWVGRVWTMGWLLIPLPCLFHQPFLRGCIWPLIGIEP